MTPAEELRAAAKKLRETAALATRGPWVFYPTVSRRDLDDDNPPFTVSRGYCETGGTEECEPDCGADVVRTGGRGCQEDHLGGDDAAWIALMSPDKAELFASWLEVAAREVGLNEYRPPRRHYDPAEALAVARAINGGTA